VVLSFLMGVCIRHGWKFLGGDRILTWSHYGAAGEPSPQRKLGSESQWNILCA
jgi:hypothetical protein